MKKIKKSVNIYFTNLEILETRNEYLDKFLKNQLINFIFVNFCILILVNGSNFIDGLNGLCLGYYLLILLFLLSININNTLFSDNQGLIIFGISLIVLLIFNFSNLTINCLFCSKIIRRKCRLF